MSRNRLLAIAMTVVMLLTLFTFEGSASGFAAQNSVADSANAVDENELRVAIAKHANTFSLYSAVREDGTVVFEDSVVEGWTNVASVEENGVPVALTWDGTVLTEDNDPIVAQWRNIVAIYYTVEGIVGLRLDGTVVSSEPDSICNTWTNVESIHASGVPPYLAAVTKDGKVLCINENYDLSTWTDIVKINCDWGRVLGIRRDGTVLCADNEGTKVMEGWTDVVAVDSYWDIMALRKDGTILTTAKEMLGTPLDFSGWKNIVAIDVWGYDYAGLKADGSVITTGEFICIDGELDASEWKNMVEIKVGGYNMIGLREDGTVLACNGSETVHLFTNVKVNTVPKPSVEDVKPFGKVITYPDPGTYLDEYETKYVKAPKGNSIYVFWNYNGGVVASRRKFNLYEGDEVTVLARQGTRSCVIFKDKNGKEQIGWINSDYLAFEKE